MTQVRNLAIKENHHMIHVSPGRKIFRRKPAKSLMAGHMEEKKNDLKGRYKRGRSTIKQSIQFREVTR